MTLVTPAVTITVRRADLRLRVDALHWPGDGPPVVLIHGMVVAGRSLILLATELAGRGFEVWVPDLPGFGSSGRHCRALGVNGLADALAAWAATVDLPSAAVVGNSFGSQVAAALVHRHPGTAKRLALVAPTIDPRLRRWCAPRLLPAPPDPPPQLAPAPEGRLRRVLRPVLIPARPFAPEAAPSLRRLLLGEYALAGPVRVVSTYRWALVDDLEARLPAVGVPVLVARGSRDRLVSPAWAARLARRAATGTYREIADVDHDAEYRAPARLADALAPFLRGGDRQAIVG